MSAIMDIVKSAYILKFVLGKTEVFMSGVSDVLMNQICGLFVDASA